jgi:hypothetical protein
MWLRQAIETRRRKGEEMKNTTILKIFMMAIVVSIILFTLGLFVGYLRDDVWSPAADERSYPAPKTY